MRTLQEWMGHPDIMTPLIYADYAPSAQEKAMVENAFKCKEPTESRRGERESPSAP